MDDKLLYSLMLKRLVVFNVVFLSLFLLFQFGFPLALIFYFMLLLDVSAILIEMKKGTHYPMYCYIHAPFKTLFNYENDKSPMKRNKNIYLISLVPLAFICFSMTFFRKSMASVPVVGLRLPFIALIALVNIEHMVRIFKLKTSNLKE